QQSALSIQSLASWMAIKTDYGVVGRLDRITLSSSDGPIVRFLFSLFELEDPFHQQPFLSRLGFRQGLLESPHQVFPFPHLRVLPIGFGLGRERKAVSDLHDHEEPRA